MKTVEEQMEQMRLKWPQARYTRVGGYAVVEVPGVQIPDPWTPSVITMLLPVSVLGQPETPWPGFFTRELFRHQGRAPVWCAETQAVEHYRKSTVAPSLSTSGGAFKPGAFPETPSSPTQWPCDDASWSMRQELDETMAPGG